MKRTFSVGLVDEAREALRNVVKETPLQFNRGLSEKFGAKIYLKREDLQTVRSYKIRGAYNRMRHLALAEKKRGIVCASAGNHAQGVAASCKILKVKGVIVMPRNTPRQKVDRVRVLGGAWAEVQLTGDSFDEAYRAARTLSDKKGKVFIHPFNDALVIAGQGTVGAEILEQSREPVDYLVVPVGGGGLIAGVGSYFKWKSPKTKIIGVEPKGAPAMYESLKAGKQIELEKIDTFVDGAAVRKVGDITLALTKKVADKVIVVPEGKVCTEMISLYQRDGIVAEPAGALSVAALEQLAKLSARGGSAFGGKRKTVVCVLSGGNNDISRYPEVIERSLVHRGLKHYFIINFSQRPGALRRFLDEALGPTDDITLFEYTKKNNRENGPALVGIELAKKANLKPLFKRMTAIGMSYEILEHDSPIFRFLI